MGSRCVWLATSPTWHGQQSNPFFPASIEIPRRRRLSNVQFHMFARDGTIGDRTEVGARVQLNPLEFAIGRVPQASGLATFPRRSFRKIPGASAAASLPAAVGWKECGDE